MSRNETNRPLPKTCGFSDVKKTAEGFACSVCGQKMTDEWKWYALSNVTHGKTNKAREVKP